jgi:molybdopterin-biosynthesis enzyme MoeA-like protein
VGHVHFVPGFPVMAHPMIAWVLDQRYADLRSPEHAELASMCSGPMKPPSRR